MTRTEKSRPLVDQTREAAKELQGNGLDVECSRSSRAPAVAQAVAHEPAGARSRWLVVVSQCPHCHGTHQHYGHTVGDLLDAFRAGCGRRYQLRLVSLQTRGGASGS